MLEGDSQLSPSDDPRLAREYMGGAEIVGKGHLGHAEHVNATGKDEICSHQRHLEKRYEERRTPERMQRRRFQTSTLALLWLLLCVRAYFGFTDREEITHL